MKSPARLLFAMCAALAWCPVAAPHESPQLPVLAQDLRQLEVPDKVVAALWTRRVDNCTLQLVFPNQGRGMMFIGDTIANLRRLDPTFGTRTLALIEGRRLANDGTTPAATRSPAQVSKWTVPVIHAWLLRPDGTIIMPLSTATPGSTPQDQVAREALFTFSLSATREASAVAVTIDGEYHVQKLQPFPDELP